MGSLLLVFSPCKFCDGNCCISFVITVTSFDVKRIIEATGLRAEEFAELRSLDLLSFDDNQVIETTDGEYKGYYVLALKSHPCYFFDSKNGCKINDYKPLACRIYPHDQRGDFGKRAFCPFLPSLFFRLSKPSKELLAKYEKEKKIYSQLVKKCNQKKITKDEAFAFLTRSFE